MAGLFSFHLMLMELDTALVAGTSLNVTLHTSQGDIQIDMPVMKPGMSHGRKNDQKPNMKQHGEDIAAPMPEMSQ